MRNTVRWLILGILMALLASLTACQQQLNLSLNSFGLFGGSRRPQSVVAGNSQLYLPLIANERLFSTSYYMRSSDPRVAYDKGCALGTLDKGMVGTQKRLAIIDFGKPVQVINGEPGIGTKLFFTTARISISQIEDSAFHYAMGYYICTGEDRSSTLIMGIGTNNYQDDDTCSFCAVNYAHGKAWAEMVNRVNDRLIDGGYSSQVVAVGANDIELAWNTFERTTDWLNGYDSVNRYEMLNFGAIEGCPYFSAPGASCAAGWDRDKAWYVTWGSPPVYPVPEIYANNGVNAQQWYLMSKYSAENHGSAMIFRAIMTQYQACMNTWNSTTGKYGDSSCEYLDNTPEQGYDQLQSLVNGNDQIRHVIQYSTDIKW